MCPALPLADAQPATRLTMPVFIESGERDVLIAEVSRKIAATMKRSGRPFIYVEIPGGTHRTPIEQIDWVRALDFVEAHRL
jgi:pimeloyl-ACP methyl ester carboxylesterase